MGAGHDDHMIPFTGRIDWRDFYKALKEVDFDGVLCLETGPSVNLSPEAFEFALKAMYVFSQDILKEV